MKLINFSFQALFILCFLNSKFAPVLAITESDLFPYDELYGNTRYNFGDDGRIQVHFSQSFKIFNKTHSYIVISGNGATAFGTSEISAASCSATANDNQFIFPFWADANNGRDSNCKLLYKQTSSDEHLTKAKNEIIKGFPKFKRTLRLRWMLVVTWKRLPQHNGNSYERNTFQMVLATDGTNSFVLFYYLQLEWPSSGDSRGNAGFDFGNSHPLYQLPGSCSKSNMFYLTKTSNVGENNPGLYVFKVDSTLEVPDVLSNLKTNNQEILFEPKIVSVMGNVPIICRGFQLDFNSNVTCEFRDPSQLKPVLKKGTILYSVNGTTVICPAPSFKSLGRVEMNLLVTNIKFPTVFYKGHIFVVKEHEAGLLPQIFINKTMENALLLSAQWDPVIIKMDNVKSLALTDFDDGNNGSTRCQNFHEAIEVVVLENDGQSWKELGAVTPSILNNGVHLSPLNISALNELIKRSNKPLPRSFGLKGKYTLQSGEEIIKIIPSNTFIGTDLIMAGLQSGKPDPTNKTVFDSMCKNWHKREPHPPMDALPCPPTTEQAVNDWRFISDNEPHLQLFNPGASSSFIQSVPSPSGAGSQCTYDNLGNLLVGNPSAGHLHRHSPNNKNDYWSHYWQDVLPFLYCCKWSSSKSFNCNSYFYNKRPVNSAEGYVFPKPARITGASHITTFDESNYTLIGPGEFWLMKLFEDDDELVHMHGQENELKFQVRMESYQSVSSPAVTLTSAVVKSVSNGNNAKVQTVLSTGHIKVLVDDEVINAKHSEDDPDEFKVYLEGFNLYHDGLIIQLKSKNKIIISFSSGVSVLLMSSEVGISMIATAASDLTNRVEGLLGGFDNDSSNNMELNNDTTNDPTTNDNQHFNGLDLHVERKWQLKERETLFSYSPQQYFVNFNQPIHNFPLFHSGANGTDVVLDKQEFCDDFIECNYDYYVTNDIFLALIGKIDFALYNFVRNVSKRNVGVCKIPQITNGRISVLTVSVGSNLTASCNSGYKLFQNSPKLTFKATFTCQEKDRESPKWVNAISNEDMQLLTCVDRNSRITESPVQTTARKPMTTTNSSFRRKTAQPISTTKTTETKTTTAKPTNPFYLTTVALSPKLMTLTTVAATQPFNLSAYTDKSSTSVYKRDEEPLEIATSAPLKIDHGSKGASNSWEFGIIIGCIVIGIIIVAVIFSEYAPCKPVRVYIANKFQRNSQSDRVELEL